MDAATLYDGSAAEVARRMGVSRRYVMRLRSRARERDGLPRAQARRASDAIDLARQAAAERERAEMTAADLRARLDEREAYIAAVEQALHAVRKAYRREHARATRFSDEARDLRKGDVSHRRFLMLAFAVYDLLPPTVWTSLLAGEDVHAEFVGRMVDGGDAEGCIAMDQRALDVMGALVDTMGEHAHLLRAAVTIRESLDMDEDGPGPQRSQTDRARRNRFALALGSELYGDVDD